MTLSDFQQYLYSQFCRHHDPPEPLTMARVFTYDHDAGIVLDGYVYPQWLYAVCPKCAHHWTAKELMGATKKTEINVTSNIKPTIPETETTFGEMDDEPHIMFRELHNDKSNIPGTTEYLVRELVSSFTELNTNSVKRKYTILLTLIVTQEGMKTYEYAATMNEPEKSIEKYMKGLRDAGITEHRGSKRTGGHFLKPEFREKFDETE